MRGRGAGRGIPPAFGGGGFNFGSPPFLFSSYDLDTPSLLFLDQDPVTQARIDKISKLALVDEEFSQKVYTTSFFHSQSCHLVSCSR